MTTDLASIVTLAVAVVIGILSAAAVVAAIYVQSVYNEREADVREFRRLVKRDRRIAFGGLIVELLVVWACLAAVWPETFQPIPRPWGAVAIGIVVALMMYGPIDDAIAFRELRRSGRGALASDQEDVP